MKTPTIEITRTYDPDVESQLKALEALLRSPPREEDSGDGHRAALSEQFDDSAQGQKGASCDTRSAA